MVCSDFFFLLHLVITCSFLLPNMIAPHNSGKETAKNKDKITLSIQKLWGQGLLTWDSWTCGFNNIKKGQKKTSKHCRKMKLQELTK